MNEKYIFNNQINVSYFKFVKVSFPIKTMGQTIRLYGEIL